MGNRSATIPVSEVMTRTPTSVAPDATIGHVMALFDRHDFNAIPVCDTRGVMRGIITKLDVLRAFRPDPMLQTFEVSTVSARRAADVMRLGVVSVEPEDLVTRAVDLMIETRLHTLPVADRTSGGPVLVGIVSQGDVFRALRSNAPESQLAHAEA